jgi:hypothetical protein
MSINSKLFSLYSKNISSLSLVADKYNNGLHKKAEKTAYPLFIRSNSGYECADVKLLIFGQETNMWCAEDEKIFSSNISLNEILELYDNFFGKKACYKKPSNFWPCIKYLIDKLQEKNSCIKIDYLWSNIIKMAYYYKKGIPSFYEKIVKPILNSLVVKEVKILKPDFILFFTGPYYDFVIDDIFKNPQKKKINKFNERQLCEIVIQDVKKCFRTYHPQYLNRSKLKNKVINKIIRTINDNA